MTDVLNRAMTEDELLSAIVEAAAFRGWLVHHIRRSDKAQQMGHPGFPDLVLARKGRILFLELKSDKGVLRADQAEWLNAVTPDAWAELRLPPVEGRVVRPADLDTILALLP